MSDDKKYSKIKQIRILPMGTEEFPSKGAVDCFLGGTLTTHSELKAYKGTYQYRRHSIATDGNGNQLSDDYRLFVLFQYGGELIACGEMESQKKYDEPKPVCEGSDKFYNGYYQFDTDTVKLFKEPVRFEEFSRVVPKIKPFREGTQIIPKDYLEDILRIIIKHV